MAARSVDIFCARGRPACEATVKKSYKQSSFGHSREQMAVLFRRRCPDAQRWVACAVPVFGACVNVSRDMQ